MRHVPETVIGLVKIQSKMVLDLQKSSTKCFPQKLSFPEAEGLLPPYPVSVSSYRTPPQLSPED